MSSVSLAGRTLSNFTIVEEINRRGIGVVHWATDTRLSHDLALKRRPPELIADSGCRDRFVQDARAASAMEQPNITAIHDIGESDGFILMALVHGDTLSAAIARGQLAPARAHGLFKCWKDGDLDRDKVQEAARKLQ